jgi:WD40 repeat protein
MRFVSFLSDGKHFVAVGKFGYIAVVDIDSGEIIRFWEDDIKHHFFPHFVTLSPDRKKLLLGSDMDDEYMIWDVETGQEKWVDMPGGILSFAVSPDSRTLACGRQNGVDLYQLDTGQKIKTFPLIQTNVTALAFSPDGKHLAFGSDNNASAYYSVRFTILDIETGIPRYSLFTPVDDTPFAVCDPDGEHLYTRASRNILKVWDTASISYFPVLPRKRNCTQHQVGPGLGPPRDIGQLPVEFPFRKVLTRRVHKHKLALRAVYDPPYRVAGSLGDGADNRHFFTAKGINQRGLSRGGPPHHRHKRGFPVTHSRYLSPDRRDARRSAFPAAPIR